MPCLLNDGPECKDVINGTVLRSESNLSSSFELLPLKAILQRVAYLDRLVVVEICTRASFVDTVNNVM